VSARPVPRLTYFDAWVDPVAGEILAGRAGLEVVRLAAVGDTGENWATLAATHGYQALTRSEATAARAEQWLAGADFLARCPNLLAICSAGAGYDVVDVVACTAAGVIVCNQSGAGAEAVAEHALGLMLALSKKIIQADRALRRSADWDRFAFKGNDLLGKTVGIIGFGQIGGRLGDLCRGLFEMTVLVYDPYLTADQVATRGGQKVELAELLRRADFVSLNGPLTPETAGMFGRAEFAQMKPGAHFITTARGGVHDERALVEALASGRLAGAGVDVFDREPPPPDHPLLAFENVVATPHVAGITVEANRALARATAEQWITIFQGGVPPRLVNPEAWPRYRERFERLLGFRPDAL
jgi:D-3-phosphoglycerate dehydrogenase